MRDTDSILEKGGQSLRLPVLAGLKSGRESASRFDPLLQSESGSDYTILIETGATSGICSQAHRLDTEPITLHSHSSLTINYLDTGGLPLTPLHLSMVTALVSRMVGLKADGGKLEQHRRLIARYLRQLYEDSYREWVNRHPEKVLKIARHACALATYRQRRLARGSTFLDAFVDFRDWRSDRPADAFAFLASFDDSEVARFSKEMAHAVRDLAFAYFTCAEYPTHQMLQELMYLDASGTDKDQVHRLAELLLPWCRGRDYGGLFDGESNVSLFGKSVHFYVGHIHESTKDLKSAIGLLIANAARQHVITLPRSQRKRIVCSGIELFFDDPENEKVAKEVYVQMREFNCSIVKCCSPNSA